MSEASEALAGALIDEHPRDAASILERFTPGEAADAIRAMPAERRAALLGALTAAYAARVALALPAEIAADALGAIPPALAAAALLQLDVDEREALLRALPSTARVRLDRVLAQPPDSAGRLMSPLVVTLDGDLAAGEALEAARRAAPVLPDYLYVVARPAAFLGAVELSALLSAEPDALLRSLVHPEIQPIAARASVRAVLDHPTWLSAHALPVVADGDGLVGAIDFATLQRLRSRAAGARQRGAVDAALAFGELYWTGLTHAVDAIAAAGTGRARHDGGSM